MPMKKAEMEAHNLQYDDYMAVAQSAEEHGLFKGAVKAAISAWDFIDGMMQYRAKYADAKFSSIPAIDLVLKYAPLLLDSKSLDRLEQLLRERSAHVPRNTSEDVAEELKAARGQDVGKSPIARISAANSRARTGGVTQDIRVSAQDHWRSVAECVGENGANSSHVSGWILSTIAVDAVGTGRDCEMPFVWEHIRSSKGHVPRKGCMSEVPEGCLLCSDCAGYESAASGSRSCITLFAS